MAVVGMVVYHVVFFQSLSEFSWIDVSVFWRLFALCVQCTFFLLFGVSLSIAFARNSQFSFFVRRWKWLWLSSAVVTITSTLLFPQAPVVFGVLHFLSVVGIVTYFFLPFSTRIFFSLSIFSWLCGWLFSRTVVSYSWLIWLGVAPAHFQSLDYFPLFPWASLVWLGVIVGKLFYSDVSWRMTLPSPTRLFFPFQWLGQNALGVYLAHFVVLWLLFF